MELIYGVADSMSKYKVDCTNVKIAKTEYVSYFGFASEWFETVDNEINQYLQENLRLFIRMFGIENWLKTAYNLKKHMGSIIIFLSRKNCNRAHMLNKNCIKTILNVKHTCIDKVTMLADTSIMIEVHATKGEQCRCGICGKIKVL